MNKTVDLVYGGAEACSVVEACLIMQNVRRETPNGETLRLQNATFVYKSIKTEVKLLFFSCNMVKRLC